jgi:hypothetical protein
MLGNKLKIKLSSTLKSRLKRLDGGFVYYPTALKSERVRVVKDLNASLPVEKWEELSAWLAGSTKKPKIIKVKSMNLIRSASDGKIGRGTGSALKKAKR